MTLVVAEIGINHNGDVGIAKQLIDVAQQAGCDLVKFQKRTIDVVYSEEEQARPRESRWGETNGDQKRGLEFGQDEYEQINDYCRMVGIDWFASAWDLGAVTFLDQFNPTYQKVASPILTHENMVKVLAVKGRARHTLISTGMTGLGRIRDVCDIFTYAMARFTLMHCVSTYPTPENQLNLAMIRTLRSVHPHVGYSGHETSPWPTLAAVVLGAEVVERHITLDRAMYGSDQAASIGPRDLTLLVQQIRALPRWLGDGIKTVTPDEQAVADKLRYWA